MIACVVNSNMILEDPFKTKTKIQLTETYLNIKKELDKRYIVINMHVVDNEDPELQKGDIDR